MKGSKEQTLEKKDLAILENNVPFQISNGPQLWLVKLRASLCIDKYYLFRLVWIV
jgi:hypothetical protein